MHCCLHGKAKNKKKLEVALPSAMTIILGKENLKETSFAECQGFGTRQRIFFKKYKKTGFAECLGCGTKQRGFLKKTNFFAECLSCSTRQRVFLKKEFFFAECCTRQRK
jgi:hypothetical protein